ncbi:cytochrome c oxidase subunit 2 [Neorhizobium huautlense]|uniref:cytochrome-c oxidase n=1 Tax=Neorhizobium huautlense TaxID=67774 RepID=A0ABT9Q015_9HYPH|nr:cytochrome c oxidase subunit II [Neorhizobium huautlense]MDP9840068.1 cytochrome c oxidase subunit 2 [Neorhizobium huautlense]
MKRVAGHRDHGTGILLRNLCNDRIGRFGFIFHQSSPLSGQSHGEWSWFRSLGAIGLASLVSGCSGELSALDPAGPSAASIADLWWVMLWGSCALFALVLGLFLAAWFVPDFGRRLPPDRWIVWGGLALPLPVLIALTLYAFNQGEFLLKGATKDTEDVLEVRATGRMWEWDFSYPTLPGSVAEPGVLHIPAGRTIEIVAESEDVIHSFWVPRLGGKIDAVPGHANRLRIRADKPGRYGGICSEYCGTGHAGMRFEVRAHDEDGFVRAVSAETSE